MQNLCFYWQCTRKHVILHLDQHIICDLETSKVGLEMPYSKMWVNWTWFFSFNQLTPYTLCNIFYTYSKTSENNFGSSLPWSRWGHSFFFGWSTFFTSNSFVCVIFNSLFFNSTSATPCWWTTRCPCTVCWCTRHLLQGNWFKCFFCFCSLKV